MGLTFSANGQFLRQTRHFESSCNAKPSRNPGLTSSGNSKELSLVLLLVGEDQEFSAC
jgi:hypothetical protein